MLMTMEKSLYDVMGVGRHASLEEIRSSYRRLAARYHPDRYPDRAERFREINQAYLILSDPQKRKDYDSTLPSEKERKPTIGDQIEAALRGGIRKPRPERKGSGDGRRPVSKSKDHQTWVAPKPIKPKVLGSVAFRDFSPWAKDKIREEFGRGVGSSRWEPHIMSAQNFVDQWIVPMGFRIREAALSALEEKNVRNHGNGSDIPDTFFLDPGPPVRIWGKHRAVLASRKGVERVTVYVRI